MRVPDSADDRTTLVRRATELATPTVAPRTGATLDLVSFRVGREVFAIEARFVREVVRLQQVSPVPGAAGVVRGVTTYQGQILALVDLLGALGIEGERPHDARWVVVLGEGTAEFGVTADELRGSLEVHVDDLLPIGAAKGSRTRYIKATTVDAVAVLDGEVLLASEDLFGGAPGGRVLPRDDHERATDRTDQKESTL